MMKDSKKDTNLPTNTYTHVRKGAAETNEERVIRGRDGEKRGKG